MSFPCIADTSRPPSLRIGHDDERTDTPVAYDQPISQQEHFQPRVITKILELGLGLGPRRADRARKFES